MREAAANLPEETDETEVLDEELVEDEETTEEDLDRRARGRNMTTDTTEKGLETLIVEAMTGAKVDPAQTDMGKEPTALYGGTGWILGRWQDYDREYAVDLVQLTAFLNSTQPELVEALDLKNASPTRQKFLARLQGEITKRGIIDVLRKGVKHGPHNLDLFYGTPTPGNTKAEERYALNRFSVTRQLRYSRDETKLALDLALFINGLPVATFELKNSLTKQTVEDAVEQYKRDRDSERASFPVRALHGPFCCG